MATASQIADINKQAAAIQSSLDSSVKAGTVKSGPKPQVLGASTGPSDAIKNLSISLAGGAKNSTTSSNLKNLSINLANNYTKEQKKKGPSKSLRDLSISLAKGNTAATGASALRASTANTAESTSTVSAGSKSSVGATSSNSFAEQVEKARQEGLRIQAEVAKLRKQEETSAGGITASDSTIIDEEKNAQNNIKNASASAPTNSALTLLDQEMKRLQDTLRTNEQAVNKGFDANKATIEQQQAREAGATSVGLANAGGYLGFSGSGNAVMLSLANSHRAELTQLEAKRQQAIADARNASAEKRYDIVRLKAEEIKRIDQETYQRQETYNAQVKAVADEETKKADVKKIEETKLANENTIYSAIKNGATDAKSIFDATKGKIAIKEIQDFITGATPKIPSGSKLFGFNPTQTGLLLGSGLNKDDIAALNEAINTTGYTDEIRAALPASVRAVTDKIYHGKVTGGVGSSDPAIGSSDLDKLFGRVIGNAGSVKNIGIQQKNFDAAVARGDTKEQENIINALAIKGLSAGQQSIFSGMRDITEMRGKLQPLEDSFRKTNPGLYTSMLQSNAKFVNASKDPAWLNFVARAQNIVAGYRNSIYGASLTNNELKSANISLPDFSNDTFSNIITKLDILDEFAQVRRNSMIQDSAGKFTDNPLGFSSDDTEYANLIMGASPEQLKALGQ